jgi:nucleoside triphosphate diphosphatase
VTAKIAPLVKIMKQLRDPQAGCPWDLEQNFETIAPYTIEEAYEVADAINNKDFVSLRDELGDLLLQVVFHSQMASEAGKFDLSDVIGSICAKMIRRHPHVFGAHKGISTASVAAKWEDIKAAERANKQENSGALSGVAKSLPALLRAQKIQNRAARTGFDWPDVIGALDKVEEEIIEFKGALNLKDRTEEMGDLLFSIVNVCRFLEIDAEQTLTAATRKFEQRFQFMEQSASDFFTLSLDQKEALWQQAKSSLQP